MNQQAFNLSVLGLEIAFRPGADMERATRVAQLVEERFAGLKKKSQVGQSKDMLLVFLAYELADELLQLKKKQALTEYRIQELLEKIEKSL